MSKLPGAFIIQSARLRSNTPNFASNSKSLITHVRRIPGHRWEWTLRSRPLKDGNLLAAFAWQVSLKGQYQVFTAVIPFYSHTKGVGAGNPVVRSAAQPGQELVQLNGFQGASSGQLKPGDFIKFSNHEKVYMVVSEVNSNVSGQATVHITPELRKAVALGTGVAIRDVPFTLRQARDIQEFSANGREGRITTLELDCYEAL